ncbi:Ribonuclease HII [Rhodospirillaceae bacterium LM-1]|nr:Ribonuclease HII [Rhodospirillaceae bacterium LM-1]
MPDFSLEQAAKGIVAGIDEAGRGPWAGPVVAGAAILDRQRIPADIANRLDDSKKLSPAKREALFALLTQGDWALIGIGMASPAEIDSLNILQATYLAMRRALDALGVKADLALVDGNRPPPLPCKVQTVVKGDGLSLSIAAASIAAKVTRDRLMTDLSLRYPGYGWESNAGYGTAQHQAALAQLGVTPEHRRSFAPVAALVGRPVR